MVDRRPPGRAEYNPSWFGRGMGLGAVREACEAFAWTAAKQGAPEPAQAAFSSTAPSFGWTSATPAVEGQWGDRHTYVTAGRLRDKFGLDRPDITALMLRWNQTCLPPWTDRGLESKIDSAMKAPPGAFLRVGGVARRRMGLL